MGKTVLHLQVCSKSNSYQDTLCKAARTESSLCLLINMTILPQTMPSDEGAWDAHKFLHGTELVGQPPHSSGEPGPKSPAVSLTWQPWVPETHVPKDASDLGHISQLRPDMRRENIKTQRGNHTIWP